MLGTSITDPTQHQLSRSEPSSAGQLIRQQFVPTTISSPQLSFFADWLWLIPGYIARNQLLDSAAQYLALGFFGYETQNAVLERNGREAYSKALWYLSRAIVDVDLGLSSETLCATMLLGFYEIYMRTEKVSWVTHAGGAGRLMQIRGAHRHREGFDHIMFLGFRAVIIAEAVSSGQPCFLDSEDWREVVTSSKTHTTSSVTFRLHNEFSNLFAAVPGIEYQSNKINEENTTSSSRASALEGAASLRDDFKAWYWRFTSAFPNSELGSTEQVMYEGSPSAPVPSDSQEVWTAAWLCAYYACLIMLNTRISRLKDVDTGVENSEIIGKLCSAVGRCAREGNSGGQCLAFALPVALSLCKDELNGWVQESFASVEGRRGVRRRSLLC